MAEQERDMGPGLPRIREVQPQGSRPNWYWRRERMTMRQLRAMWRADRLKKSFASKREIEEYLRRHK